MIRRVLSTLLTLLAIMALSAPLYAAETITHQGRLLGADDQPVADGFYGATFSLWDDPVAGVQVWSEFRDIQTKSGLFSVELGQVSSFFDIFTEFADRDLYLQVQVHVGGGNEELRPRLRIGRAPAAMSSKTIHGIHAGPNRSSSCLVIATDSGAVAYLDEDSDDDGVADGFVALNSSSTETQLSVARKRPGRVKYSNIALRTTENEVSEDQDCDSDGDDVIDSRLSSSLGGGGGAGGSLALAADLDGDGAMDRSVSSSCDATSAKHAINTKGTGAQAGRSASLSATATPGGASSACSLDLDGDGVLESRIDDDCDDFSSSRSMSFFDVFTESAIDDDCDGTEARRRLSSSNLGSSGQDGVSVDLRCSPDSAVQSTELRRSGAVVCGDYGRHTPFHNTRSMSFFDIFTEMSIDQDCDATGSRMAIKTKGTGAQRTVACSTDASSSSVVAAGDLDGDGLDDSEASLRITPTKSSLAVQTKGTSAKRLRGGTDCDDTDARDYLDCDDDGDGIAESSISSIANSDGASLSVNNINGGMPNRISMNLTVSKQTQGATFGEKCFVDGDDIPESEVSHSVTPTTSSMAIKTKGTGADKNRTVSSSCDDVSALHFVDVDDDGDGVVESFSRQTCTPDSVVNEVSFEFTNSLLMPALMKAKEKANRTKCSNSLRCEIPGTVHETENACDSASARATWTSSNGGALSSVTIQASISPLDNPIEHSSGAHLTVGGVWTNASDENLKENFQPVDGEEILDKIEQLEISQWNYKSESDEVTHIGPTAQDFKKTFGVGENDKSISTIDPSGIALVAVKELHKENQELKAQVAELKKMVEELARKK